MENEHSVMALSLEVNCPICFEDFRSKTFSELDSCNHTMCGVCFQSLIKYSNKCPLCAQVFNSCRYKEGDSTVSEYFITEMELDDINNHKLSFYKDENFECFSRDEIRRELNHYKKIAENIKFMLFMQRNGDGSSKELLIFEDIMDRVTSCNDLVNFEPFDSKNVMKNLDTIVQGIKDLQNRTYKHQQYEEDDLIYFDDKSSDFTCSFPIEYVDRKKSGSRGSRNKKKKK